MAPHYVVDDLAGFVVGADSTDLTGRARELLKRNGPTSSPRSPTWTRSRSHNSPTCWVR